MTLSQLFRRLILIYTTSLTLGLFFVALKIFTGPLMVFPLLMVTLFVVSFCVSKLYFSHSSAMKFPLKNVRVNELLFCLVIALGFTVFLFRNLYYLGTIGLILALSCMILMLFAYFFISPSGSDLPKSR